MMRRIALFCLFAISFCRMAGAEQEDLPLRIAAGLFDLSNKESLGLDTIRGTHIEIHHATNASGFRFSHHPGLAVYKGHLFCSWSSGHAHEDRPGQRVLLASNPDGTTWSSPQVLAAPEGEHDRCIAAGFYDTENTLVAYYTLTVDYPEHNFFNRSNALFARVATDGSKWSDARKVVSGFFIAPPHRLPRGRLLLAGEHVGQEWKTKQVRMQLVYSDEHDGIAGWKQSRIDPARAQPIGLNVFGYTEPCPFVRADGAVVSPFRNQSGFLYASVSRDNGATWSVPRQTTFPDSMSRVCTGRLPDGTVFLINNPGPEKGNRSLLTIALSDDGIIFDRAWLIRSAPTAQRFPGKGKRDGWQYPDARVWRDALYVVYSVNKADIVITRIPLGRL